MEILSEIIIAVAVCTALLAVVWAARGMLLTPVRRHEGAEIFVVVRASGEAEGLEQVIDGLLWLRDSGKAQMDVIIACAELTDEAKKRASRLAEKCGGMICPAKDLAKYTEDIAWRKENT